MNDKQLVDVLRAKLGSDGTKHLRFDSLKEAWYHWSPATGAWAAASNTHIENFVEAGFDTVEGLSATDLRHVMSRRGRADMRALLGGKLRVPRMLVVTKCI